MPKQNYKPAALFDAAYFEKIGWSGQDLAQQHHVHQNLAKQLIHDFEPQSVLDVGCALGLLVGHLRFFGIHAEGFDISDYALHHIPTELQAHIHQASILDPHAAFKTYDLVVCLDVLEYLQPDEAAAAIANLCRWGDKILFSANPLPPNNLDLNVNAQPPAYWLAQFAQHGFLHRLDYDASFIKPWAFLLCRQPQTQLTDLVNEYENHLWESKTTANSISPIPYRNAYQSPHEAEINRLCEQHQAELNAIFAEVDQELGQIRYELENELAKRNANHLSEISSLLDQLHETKRLLDYERSQISAMTSTQSWQMIQSWWRLKQNLFPAHSRRLRLYQLARRGGQTLKNEGISGFLGRLRAWLSGKRGYWAEAEVRSSLAPRPAPSIPPDQIVPGVNWFPPRPAADVFYEAHIQASEPSHDDWLAQRAAAERQNWPTSFAILSHIQDDNLPVFLDVLNSILSQTYQNWRCYLAVNPSASQTKAHLNALAAQDARFELIELASDLSNPAEAYTQLAQRTTEDFMIHVGAGDALAPHALYSLAALIQDKPQTAIIYSDQDQLNEHGQRCEPLFKPQWSPELMLSTDLLSGLCAYRRELVAQIGGYNTALSSAWAYDFHLKLSRNAKDIQHIPQVLYHARRYLAPSPTSESREQISAALRDHLTRQGCQAPEIIFKADHPIHRDYPLVRWSLKDAPKISIIIPSRNIDTVKPCLDGLLNRTNYPNFEIILVYTQGQPDPQAAEFYAAYQADSRFRLIPYSYDGLFNYSAACNFGAKSATGDLLLFLNDDTEMQDPAWLSRMAQWFTLEGVGMVGAKLLYPNRTLQHAGGILGMGGFISHLFLEQPENTMSIFGSDGWYRNLSAVTGACLLISRAVYDAVGGFDETYTLWFSDIDLGVKVRRAGYRIVYSPDVELIHRESTTTYREASDQQRRIPRKDWEYASQQWRAEIAAGDPYFNPNLSYQNAVPQFRKDAHDTAAQANLRWMAALPDKEIITFPADMFG